MIIGYEVVFVEFNFLQSSSLINFNANLVSTFRCHKGNWYRTDTGMLAAQGSRDADENLHRRNYGLSDCAAAGETGRLEETGSHHR